jgi:hypothetical protein
MRYIGMFGLMTVMFAVTTNSTSGTANPPTQRSESTDATASRDQRHTPPPPRSKRCPPDRRDDRRDSSCGKGDDSRLP